jgi:hypothetical protein
MIVIDIFKENHRFSEQTLHPAPRSVVGAANLAASSRGSKTDFRSPAFAFPVPMEKGNDH